MQRKKEEERNKKERLKKRVISLPSNKPRKLMSKNY